MSNYYNGKRYAEVAPGIWKPIGEEIMHLEETVKFIEDYLRVSRRSMKDAEMHALNIIKEMDKIKYTN